MTTTSACPGCGVLLPVSDGPAHPYIGASPACWALYGEVSVRTYPDDPREHDLQIAVDAYAAQHPGVPERRSIQSVALHLMTLCLVFDRGADPGHGSSLHKRMAHRPFYTWLEPPDPRGSLTVAHVAGAATAAEHSQRVREWGQDVWEAWAPHRATVEQWITLTLG